MILDDPFPAGVKVLRAGNDPSREDVGVGHELALPTSPQHQALVIEQRVLGARILGHNDH